MVLGFRVEAFRVQGSGFGRVLDCLTSGVES